MVSASPRRKRKRASPPLLAIISVGCLTAQFPTPWCEAFQPHHRCRWHTQAHNNYYQKSSRRSYSSHPYSYRYKNDDFNHLQESTQILMSKNEEDGSGGSIIGASLLFAGTAIGAGMIALPAETIDAGFIPSVFGLIICWVFTYVTSLVTYNGCGGAGFLSVSQALGVPGEILTAALFWFLLTAIIVAYTAEGG
eukprot:CAMPEP_0181137740 /NCGR_PEP_ID=MMETSP1071-20121207/33864_1 /TAXON_ID=35127 /ORGANISM="Thalassiosira sp., Strain NH16" /LENGTH=193 /DNA_ID=CAMNT_0023224509 /DNA_START=17 /DNA_END=594 /DNA_ORIENTATION=-